MSIQQFLRSFSSETVSPYKTSVSVRDAALGSDIPEAQMCKLDAGENLWIPKEVKKAIVRRIASMSVATYPDSQSIALRQILAKRLDIDPTWIVTGNGSDELIDLCCRVFLNQGDVLVNCPPTFPMYWSFARTMGAQLREVPRDASFQIQGEKTRDALQKGKLLFVATPNNPTGTVTNEETLRMLLATGKPVVVDEAYIEFGGTTCLPLLKEFDNLIILRTFSKWAGIAGVRIGFLIANPIITSAIQAVRAPYSVNSVAQAAAGCALENEKEIMKVVRELCSARDWFIQEAKKIPGIQAIESQASCVCIQVDTVTPQDISERLRKKGIIVKPLVMKNFSGIRISIGPKKVMQKVVRALKECI